MKQSLHEPVSKCRKGKTTQELWGSGPVLLSPGKTCFWRPVSNAAFFDEVRQDSIRGALLSSVPLGGDCSSVVYHQSIPKRLISSLSLKHSSR